MRASVRTAQGLLRLGGSVRAWGGSRAWAGVRVRVAGEQRRREKKGEGGRKERKKKRKSKRKGEKERGKERAHAGEIRGRRSRVGDKQPSGTGWDGGEEKEIE